MILALYHRLGAVTALAPFRLAPLQTRVLEQVVLGIRSVTLRGARGIFAVRETRSDGNTTLARSPGSPVFMRPSFPG